MSTEIQVRTGDKIHMTDAAQWVCGECHDSGYARTLGDAAEALGEHREDFH